MSNDPRTGKATARKRRDESAMTTPSFSLDSAFDLFYSAKRAEGVRDRTQKDYRSYWRYFREWLAKANPESTDVKDITTTLLRAYIDYMMYERKKYADDQYRKKTDKPLSPVTVASRLRALQTMCKFWAEEGLLDVDPAAKIKPPRKDVEDKTVFTDEHLTALLKAPDTKTFAGFRDETLMKLLADSGLRINEAVSLRAEYIDISARCIRLPAPLNKNRKPRIIPVSAAVLRSLIVLMEENRLYFDTDFVFVANYGEPLKPDNFRTRLSRYAKAAGIDTNVTRITPHRFRDYFCTNYLLNGGDLFTLQRIVAHADIKTTQGYVKINEEAMRDSHAQYSPLSRVLGRKGGRR